MTDQKIIIDKSSKSIFPFKYFYARVYPLQRDGENEFSGVMENKINKINVTNLESYINLELEIQEKIFQKMGCDKEIIKITISQMRLAYNSKTL